MTAEACICGLCEREVPETTTHHLLPQSEAKRKKLRHYELPLVELCRMCHKQIHALFTNRELADRLNTVEALLAEPAIQRYLAWIKKVPGHQVFKART